MLKFKVDENLPREVVEILSEAGHDTMSVIDQQMVGHPDTNLAKVCQNEDRIIVTLDLDFSDIRSFPPHEYPGIIVFRLSRLDKVRVIATLLRFIPLLESEPLRGKLWIVEETNIRIRS